MTTADHDLIESPEPRFSARVVALVAAAAVLLAAIAWGAVALRPKPKPPLPSLPGWAATGARGHDRELRERAWRAWADRDPSVKLAQTAMLYAEDWPAAHESVALLATAGPAFVRVAVVLVSRERAVRYSTRNIDPERQFVTEVVEDQGQAVVLVVAPNLRSVVLTTATVGAPRAEEVSTEAVGGALLPVAAGRTPTRVVLKGQNGVSFADRVPGADTSPPTPPAPLILSEAVRGGRRVQTRTDGGDVTCEVVLADPATEAPTMVDCPLPLTPPPM